MAEFEAAVCGVLGIAKAAEVPPAVTQPAARLRHIAGAAKLLPTDAVGLARTVQWQGLVESGDSSTLLSLLNDELRLSVFVVGFHLSLLDAVLFLKLGPALRDLAPEARDQLRNVLRWYSHVAQVTGTAPLVAAPALRTVADSASVAPLTLPQSMVDSFNATSAKASQGAGSAPQGGGKKGKQKGKQKKQKPKKQAAAPAAAGEPIAEVDIRVGQIIKAWEHPKSDKLWCESIECGEEKPRQILSGLRHNFSQEQMLGRVLVVCNLKAAKLGGIPSHGMVLCAANDDHSEVEFLRPPEGAAIGERVTFVGVENGAPASASRMNKKKIFAKAAVELKTTADCVAAHNGRHMMTSAGPVVVKSQANRPIA